jgi:hypothetical protein
MGEVLVCPVCVSQFCLLRSPGATCQTTGKARPKGMEAGVVGNADADGHGNEAAPPAKPLNRMNKAELLAEAEARGVEVTAEATNAEIREALSGE